MTFLRAPNGHIYFPRLVDWVLWHIKLCRSRLYMCRFFPQRNLDICPSIAWSLICCRLDKFKVCIYSIKNLSRRYSELRNIVTAYKINTKKLHPINKDILSFWVFGLSSSSLLLYSQRLADVSFGLLPVFLVELRSQHETKSKAKGTSKSNSTQWNRKVVYGWPYMERKRKPSAFMG